MGLVNSSVVIISQIGIIPFICIFIQNWYNLEKVVRFKVGAYKCMPLLRVILTDMRTSMIAYLAFVGVGRGRLLGKGVDLTLSTGCFHSDNSRFTAF